MEPKPEEYAVYWTDKRVVEKLAHKLDVATTAIDPAHIEEMRSFAQLDDARTFCKEVGGYIERRVDIRWDHRTHEWDWDQEIVDEE